MAPITINIDSIEFLKDLSKNNNREWFNTYKDRYVEAQNNIVAFADALIIEMNRHDQIETASGKKSLFRIYKDVRFSKDKMPYNTHWSGSLKRATKKLRGGYYFRLEPGNSFIAAGFFGPEPNDMKRIRQDIDANYEDWGKLLANPALVKTFGKMRGAQIKSAPRGYAKDHPAIDLLQYKQFLFKYEFSDEEILNSDFLFKVNAIFKNMRPFLDYMSEVLSTDANGISILD
ncbi:uncharacterized protein (TIGR02453 family) [Mucilaginibacter frigoritolerans]|uniref:Uncharacterized protein (TIGR02453 family) n=1 Tax=Mucilaginibacter frigoritolerans TaxID=652788 RepID=A0A562U536_9SPHI|nr:DUF2461 domain-containing protein [Mucilaginibacter frigoritolerans]TWJ00898.1 uncharacterized protein (TIGR02453 family) [Mucilaginibacter frigoritolerans]